MAEPVRQLITGAIVFDGVDTVLRQQDILIDDDRIVEVRPGISAIAERIDAAGKWVCPGFFDMHVHLWDMGNEALPVLVGMGVTTVRDVGGDTARLRQMQLDVQKRKVVGPNIVYSGPLLQQYPARSFDSEHRGSAPGTRPFRNEAEAAEGVRRLIEEEGVGSLKIYTSVREPIAAAILKAADGRVPVTAHLSLTGSVFVLERGIGALEHIQQSLVRDLAPPEHALGPDIGFDTPGWMGIVLRAWAKVQIDGPEVERWLRAFLDSGACLDPTITVTSVRYDAADPRLTLVPNVFLGAQRNAAAPSGLPPPPLGTHEEIEHARNVQRDLIRLIHDHGGEMVAGTDLGTGKLPGWSLHTEMVALQGRGLKPVEVLKAATSVSAKHLWRDDLGQIAAGKQADLVILDADPTVDIANASKIDRVMRGGVLHRSADLLAMAEDDPTRYWPAQFPTATLPIRRL